MEYRAKKSVWVLPVCHVNTFINTAKGRASNAMPVRERRGRDLPGVAGELCSALLHHRRDSFGQLLGVVPLLVEILPKDECEQLM